MKAHALRSNRIMLWLALAITALAIVWVALSWQGWLLRARMATGFGARLACACRYVEGRPLESCRSDFAGLEGMGLVRLRDDAATRSVEASFPLLSRRRATFRPGFGCLPDRF
jgi:hypothetical protein